MILDIKGSKKEQQFWTVTFTCTSSTQKLENLES
jgi:hypothetical protein